MKRRFISALLCVLFILVTISCADKAAEAGIPVPLRVRAVVPDESTKLIAYDGSVSGVSGDMDSVVISVYEGTDTTGTPDAEGNLSIIGGSAMGTITDVVPGLYTITADGYSGTAQITHDSVSKRISQSDNAIDIVLSSFIDEPVGDVTVTLTSALDGITPDYLAGNFSWTIYSGEDMKTRAYSGTAMSSGAEYRLEPSSGSFAPGRYILEMQKMFPDGTVVYGVAPMRLLPGLPASGVIELNDSTASDTSLSLTVTDSMGDVIAGTGSITGTGSEYTLVILGLTAEPSEVYLYVNGEGQSITPSYASGSVTIPLTIGESGVYDILAVIIDGTPSGVGSVRTELPVNRPTLTPKIDVVGVAWEYGKSSSQLYRLYTSEEAKTTAEAAGFKAMDDPHDLVTVDIMVEPVASSEGNPGSSPFDELSPWKDMKLYALNDGGTKKDEIEDGETIRHFVDEHNDGTVDFMVYLPEAYLRVIDDSANSIRYYYVSDNEFEGSSLQPASGHYIGRYNGYIQEHYSGSSTDKLWSQPSGTSTATEFAQSLTHQEAYDVAHNRVSTVSGKIYGGLLWEEVSYVQLMYLVEYANLNSQVTLGYGDSDWQSGNSDDMPYHTGVLGSKTSYDSDVQYRYVEALFGADHGSDTVENLLVDDRVMYIAPSEESLAAARESGIFNDGGSGAAPSDWVAIGTMPSSGWITGMNYDESHPWSIGVPSAASGGSDSTYASDYVYTNSGLRSVRLPYSYATYYGAWCLHASSGPSLEDYYWSARLSFR